MTKVILSIAVWCGLALLLTSPLDATELPGSQPQSLPVNGSALYAQLRNVALDSARVYAVRDLSFNRSVLHITLNDGTIAFTRDVLGRVTGAFFSGEGEVLLLPPAQVERASMMLFTGSAILEEKFDTAFFRFNDNTFQELLPDLTPVPNGAGFAAHWNDAVQNLSQADVLRLLLTFSKFLPVTSAETPRISDQETAGDDRVLHAVIQGRKLGTFDIRFDSTAPEQISAGQLSTENGQTYYNVWTAFSTQVPKKPSEDVDSINGEGGGPDVVHVDSYKIRADVSPPTELSVDASLQMHVLKGGARTVVFELSRFLQVGRLEMDGRPLEFIQNQALEGTQLARRGNDLVAVVFPSALVTGQQLLLHFVYRGQVLSEAGGGLLYVGARGTWYPNRGLAMSTFDLEFHYPAEWTLLATGTRTDSSAASGVPPNGERTSTSREQVSHWVSDHPIPLAGFNLGKYSKHSARAGDVTVETYAASYMERSFPRKAAQQNIPDLLTPGFPRLPDSNLAVPPPPPSPAENAQSVAASSARAIDFFGERFGRYPSSTLEITQIPGALSQGWPGLIFLSSFTFLTTEEKSELKMSPVDTILSNQVIFHETAHQWWGDLVTWNGYRDQWMMEALANYSSLALVESQDSPAFRAVMEKYRDDLLRDNKNGKPLMNAGPVTFGVRLSSSQFPTGYEAISYGRGTWLLHMLRTMLRDADQAKDAVLHSRSARNQTAPHASGPDELFWRVLRKVRESYQGKSISTGELLRMFEEQLPPSLWYEGHKSLDWFYQGWVNGTSVPRLELHSVRFTDKPGSTAVSGYVLQKFAATDLVTPVPLYAAIGGRNVFLGRVFADGPETQFHLTAPAGTRKLLIDPGQTLLARRH